MSNHESDRLSECVAPFVFFFQVIGGHPDFSEQTLLIINLIFRILRLFFHVFMRACILCLLLMF